MLDIEKRCKNCKHWEIVKQRTEISCRTGHCLSWKISYCIFNESDSAMYYDSEDYNANFETGEDFGCIHFGEGMPKYHHSAGTGILNEAERIFIKEIDENGNRQSDRCSTCKGPGVIRQVCEPLSLMRSLKCYACAGAGKRVKLCGAGYL